MIQEITALLLVAIATGYAVRSIYIFFSKSAKGKTCACSSCPASDILKESKKIKST